MTAQVEAIPEAVGDWTLRGLDVDQVFARPELSDDALTAACLTTARFDPAFPGWQLYRRIVAGFTCFDAELREWAERTAWALARSTVGRTGRPYIAAAVHGPWISEAARDALCAVVTGVQPVERNRAESLGVHKLTYRKIAKPLAGGIAIGFETFCAELAAKYYFVRKMTMLDYPDSMTVSEVCNFPRGIEPGALADAVPGGNFVTLKTRTY